MLYNNQLFYGLIKLFSEIDTNNIKYSFITKEDLILNLDRLTRFKNPEIKYNRVVSDILSKYLLKPKFSKLQIEKLPIELKKTIFEKIWNDSVFKHNSKSIRSSRLNVILKNEMIETYNLNLDTLCLLDFDININGVLDFVCDIEVLPVNLKRLFILNNSNDNTVLLRRKHALRFPVEKIVLCEGITEEILLPRFSQLFGFDFDKNGIKLISAGGKNQVAKMYCSIKDELKIPVFILLDADAIETLEIIKKVIRPNDKIYLIKSGEFEDIFSLNLIKRTINNSFKNICQCCIADLKSDLPMTKTLTEFYRINELGDFQKAIFAKELANNLKYKTDLTKELSEIIIQIKSL